MKKEIKINKNKKKIIEDINEKKKKIILKIYKNVYRLKKAFPAIDTKEIREILNKKIELKKIVKNNENKDKNT